MNSKLSTAFTLVEMMVVLGILGILLALGTGALARAMESADETTCLARMKSASAALLLYASEHDGELPRSSHSAFGVSQRGWARELLPYLGYDSNIPRADFWSIAQKLYRCPSDTRPPERLSYGLNVYFELDPGMDDYPGSPQQWRRIQSVPEPARTILLAEVGANGSSTDHVMAHFWGGNLAAVEVEGDRHAGGSHYAFLDGSVRMLPLSATFDEMSGTDLWNPGSER